MTKEIKEYIIEKREEGETLQSIVDELAENFGFVTSKQNIHKFYHRWCDKERERSLMEYKIRDVLNVIARKTSIQDCVDVVLLDGLSEYKLRRFLRENEDRLEDIKADLEKRVIELYIDGKDIEDIGEILNYKGVTVEEKIIKRVLRKRIKGFM